MVLHIIHIHIASTEYVQLSIDNSNCIPSLIQLDFNRYTEQTFRIFTDQFKTNIKFCFIWFDAKVFLWNEISKSLNNFKNQLKWIKKLCFMLKLFVWNVLQFVTKYKIKWNKNNGRFQDCDYMNCNFHEFKYKITI